MSGTNSGLALLIAVSLAGCVGTLDTGPSGPGGWRPGEPRPDGSVGEPLPWEPSPDGGTPVPLAVCETDDEVGRPLLRRLTAGEVEATVRIALGVDASAWSSANLPPDPAASNGFANAEDRLRVTETWLSRWAEEATTIARLASAPPHLSRLAPCVANGRSCAEQTARSLGRRIYRRALTSAELARYASLYDRVAPTEGFDGWLRGAVFGMLLSPNVSWRSELGEAGASARELDGYEIASSLAFTFTGAPPDEALLASAEAGELGTADGRVAAARSLVLDGGAVRPGARAAFQRFAQAWLGTAALDNLERDDVLHPAWGESVRDGMRDEITAYVDAIALGGGDVAALLTTPATYVDPALASYYGLPAPAGGLARVERPEGTGVGLLAQGALMTVYASSDSTSPTRRGHFVRSRLLCGYVPPPPPSVGEIPPPSPTATTRQRYEEQHAARADCVGCHRRMDPIGFGLERFDAAGRLRSHENGVEIDDSGWIVDTSVGDATFVGQEELSARLAELPETASCLAAFEASYAFGVNEVEGRCLGERTRVALEGGSILDAWIALAGAPHVATRRQAP